MIRLLKKFIFHLATGFVVLWLNGAVSRAQPTSGSILGQVTDATSSAAPGVAVTVKNELTGIERSVVTDAAGDYVVMNLPPAAYTVTVRNPGFKKLSRGPIRLALDQKLRLDLQLELGDITEVVSVTSVAPLLDTETAATGEVIQSAQILDLPLLGRDFLELALLAPGVAAGGGGNNANLAVSGQREFANSLLIDGVEVSGNRNNDTSLRPSVDAVQEFKVLTSGYAPEFGRAAGGVIAIQTKSGGNEVHGTLYEFLRPHVTAARPFFSPQQPQLKQNNFGGSAGGPVKKDHTFFFASYEGVRLRDAFSYLDSTVPKDQLRFDGGAADLSGLKDPGTGNPIPIFDPDFYAQNFQARQFPNNVIPASRVSPGGRAIVDNFFPAPNSQGTFNGWFSNFQVNQRYRFDSDTVDARVDHNAAGADQLSVVYHARGFDSLQGDRFEGSITVPGGGD
ncbi:MAG: carboxypeptidase regulatory-like domain-containing protein, partial [Acidobacteria bacterium]|nr:carboxypeptidase regulatory-like domain-containing protein [Acidobacteriota bacterium]